MDNLVGKFHAHITVHTNQDFQPPKGWKTTIILLTKDNKDQKDIMITKHYMTGRNNIKTVQDIVNNIKNTSTMLSNNGISVIREKLEHESLPTISPAENFYRECHIKIRVPNNVKLNTIDNFVQSRNPMELTENYSTVFLNSRYYNGSVQEIDANIEKSVEEIKRINTCCEILEIKKESTIYDTNLQLDKWWA
jgi:hypothetical protein